MLLCYVDESGTPAIPGNTSHFVLCGFAIPVDKWSFCDTEISRIKKKHFLDDNEIHTGWILRSYLEQNKIVDFAQKNHADRRTEVSKLRKAELLRLQKIGKSSTYKQTKKNFAKTEAYIHLTHDERKSFILEVTQTISNWKFARVFAECIDKIHYDPNRTKQTADEQAFEQIVLRFEQYLQIYSKTLNATKSGLIIHDNNETVAKKHTALMRKFHKTGTFWGSIKNIIETPLFVNSSLTSMIQIADICCYAIRRYLENNESTLYNLIAKRGDTKNGKCVGIRHFSNKNCTCLICQAH